MVSFRKQSIKRSKQLREYTNKRKQFIEQLWIEGKGHIYCIFCGKETSLEPDIHHLDGRENEMLLDTRYWAPAHNLCHIQEYHSIEWRKLIWWDSYLIRIEKKWPDIYQKELIKMEK
jgi:hypothetical protein